MLELLVIWNKGEIQENESIIYDSSNIFAGMEPDLEPVLPG